MKKLLLLLLLLFTASCIKETRVSGNPSTPYHDLMFSLTRETRSYGLEKVGYDTAVTYKTSAFRTAYVAEYARKYDLSEEAAAEMLKKEMSEGAEFDTFIISHFATDKDTSKITMTPTVWDLTLNGHPMDSLTALKNNDTVLRYFYPYITPWSKVYIAKFKRQADSPQLELKMAGVVDRLTFSWHTQ